MMQNIFFKLIFVLIGSILLNGQAWGFYKHKITVGEFKDPEDWKESYRPGKLISNHLEQQLIREGRFYIMPGSMNVKASLGKVADPRNMDEIPGKKNEVPKMMGRTGSMDELKMSKPQARMNSGEKNGMSGKMEGGSSPTINNKYKSGIYKKISSGENKIYPSTIEGSHAYYNPLIDAEPAIYRDSFPNSIRIQDTSEMMSSMNTMQKESPLKEHEDPIPWPIRLGKVPEKGSLFEIRGQVAKFDPDTTQNAISGVLENEKHETAELEVMIELVQNRTGRVLHKQNFRALSNSGRRPFPRGMDQSHAGELNRESSSMDLALLFLVNELTSFINENISSTQLEGEIIEMKDDEVLINLGRQNGVQVGDKFRVHSVALALGDPLTGNDLGDIYVKRGIIQVLDHFEGFSKARIIVGKNFMPGNLVRSFKVFDSPVAQSSLGKNKSKFQEQIPWWDFHGLASKP